jgi:HlyD family secretion protein
VSGAANESPNFFAGAICVGLTACGNSPPPGYPGTSKPITCASPRRFRAASRGYRSFAATMVAANAPLFVLESAQEAAARAEAESRMRQSQATLADLEKARRPPEIDAARAQLAQAEAALKQSDNDLTRTQKTRRRQIPAHAAA